MRTETATSLKVGLGSHQGKSLGPFLFAVVMDRRSLCGLCCLQITRYTWGVLRRHGSILNHGFMTRKEINRGENDAIVASLV